LSTTGYRAYTTKFDLEIRAEDLPKLFGRTGEDTLRRYVSEFDRAMTEWRAMADLAAIEAVDRIKAGGALAPKDTVASLLIDHSGSLRGQRAIIATALAEIVADFWSRLGISFEILGFTTRTWHGGYSRWWWRLAGRPANPGRLCDLLHIIYRSADQSTPGAPWSIRNLMRRELLKENVDGEAILWAAHRLRSRPENRKMLVVVSDGAPVDDATLAANDTGILDRHLREVISSIKHTSDIRLGAVGLEFEVSLYYPEFVVISSKDELAGRLVPFLARLFEVGPMDASAPIDAADGDSHS
jgi:cobaltochelatase CobT